MFWTQNRCISLNLFFILQIQKIFIFIEYMIFIQMCIVSFQQIISNFYHFITKIYMPIYKLKKTTFYSSQDIFITNDQAH